MKTRRRPTPRRPPPVDQQSTLPVRARRAPIGFGKRSYNAIRFNARRYGLAVNYLVGAFWATWTSIFGSVKFMVYTKPLRISLSFALVNSQLADR